MTPPALSIVIPTLNEEAALPALLDDLRRLARDAAGPAAHGRAALGLLGPIEVVVADGGSTDATVAVAEASGARVVRAPRGRGRQLRAGAAAARGEWLLFLHADVRLPRSGDGLGSVWPWGTDRRNAWWFPLRVDASGWRYRVVELGANVRARWLGLPYGDQGLLLHRTLYDAAGGYEDVPLMEDVQLVRRIRRWGRLRPMPHAVHVSARRWQRDGVLRRTLGNWGILARWMLGASPEALARRYR